MNPIDDIRVIFFLIFWILWMIFVWPFSDTMNPIDEFRVVFSLILYCESYRWYSSYLFSDNINTIDDIRVVFSLILWILSLIFELSSLWYYEYYRWYLSCLLSYTLNPIDDILSKMLNTVKKLKYFVRIGWIWVLFKLCLFWIQYKFYSIQYLSSVYTSAVMLIGRTQV